MRFKLQSKQEQIAAFSRCCDRSAMLQAYGTVAIGISYWESLWALYASSLWFPLLVFTFLLLTANAGGAGWVHFVYSSPPTLRAFLNFTLEWSVFQAAPFAFTSSSGHHQWESPFSVWTGYAGSHFEDEARIGFHQLCMKRKKNQPLRGQGEIF